MGTFNDVISSQVYLFKANIGYEEVDYIQYWLWFGVRL